MQRRDAATSRRRISAVHREPNWRGFVRLFYVLGTLAVTAALGHTAYGFLQDVPYFQIRQVACEGPSAELRAQVELQMRPLVDGQHNLVTLKDDEIQSIIKRFPRLKDVRIQKVMPDKLVLKASERIPAAIVKAKSFFLIDNEGFAIETVRPADLKLHDLPFITGLQDDEVSLGSKIFEPSLYRALDVARLLRERNPDLHGRVSELHIERDPSAHMTALTMHLRGGMEVRFGDQNPIEKLPVLEYFMIAQKQQGINPLGLAYVDLRFRNQIVFMDREHALAAATGKLEEIRRTEEAELQQLTLRPTPANGTSRSGGTTRAGRNASPRTATISTPDAEPANFAAPRGTDTGGSRLSPRDNSANSAYPTDDSRSPAGL